MEPSRRPAGRRAGRAEGSRSRACRATGRRAVRGGARTGSSRSTGSSAAAPDVTGLKFFRTSSDLAVIVGLRRTNGAPETDRRIAMPTATRPVTSAQRRYIAALVDERRHLTLNPAVRTGLRLLDDAAYFESRDASRLIDQLTAIRVERRSTPAADAPQDGAVDMAAPALDTRAGRMLAAGSIEATVTLLDGRHVTVTIRTRTRSGRGHTNADLGADGSRTTIKVLGSTVGWIGRFGDQYRLTLRTRRSEYATAINAVLLYC